MATVDHLYARTPPKTETSLAHARNLSTVSNVTLFTSTTTHSHPSELLLHETTPQTVNYDDHPDHDRDEPIGRLPCEAPLVIHDNPMNKVEKQGYWNCPRTLNRWKWLNLGLRAALSTWAIYNTVRYFIAFSDSGDPTIQDLCLALGTSTGVSFLLSLFSFLLAIRNGLIHGVTPTYLSYVRTTMDYLSSFCLIGPAAVNFALIFIWKDSEDPFWNVDNRCHFDVDVVWSVSNTLCNNKSPYWAVWLTVSALRLALTLIISIGYHMSTLNYGSRRQRAIRGFRARISDDFSTLERALPHRDLLLQSDSTLCGTSRSEPSPQNRIPLARSHSSILSQDISLTEPLALGHPLTTEPENELLPNEFVDRFQPMASQIAQETDQALDLAHSNHSPSPETENGIPTGDLPPSYNWDEFSVGLSSHNNDNNIFNLPPVFPALGYNEFGLPYPPDQNIRMLNGYIRRMPTIESMGSGEVGSSVGASSNRAVESIFNSSRPPTRNTLLSLHSTEYDSPNSEPPSRTNSLSARAELFAGLSSVPNSISEHGELLGRTSSPVGRRLSTPISYVDHTISSDNTSWTPTSGTSSSYHTATSESFPPGLTMDTRSRSPVLGQPP